MPKVRKATPLDIAVIEKTALRGTPNGRADSGVASGVQEGSPSSDPLCASRGDFADEPPVTIVGATLTGINLTPRGYGYEVKLLIPLTEEEKLGPFRRLAFQQLINLTAEAASWSDLEDEDE